MRGLRILQIAHDHPDWTPGGTEILAYDLARSLDAREGTRATFLAAATSLQRPDDRPGALSVLGEDFVIRTGSYDRFAMLRCDGTDWIAALGRVLAEVRPNVVHLHGLDRIGAEVLPVLRRLAPSARIVLTLHDYQLLCANDGLLLSVPEGARCTAPGPDNCRSCFPGQSAARHALRKAHLMALLHLVDLFIAPSAFLRARFLDWGLAPERIRLLPNAVAPLPRPAERLRGNRNRFAFFGNIAPHKGVLTLLDAAARLAREGAELRISLHGGLLHAEPDFARAFAASLAAAGPIVQHLGPYRRADLPDLMHRADWVVVPSIWWENAPLVLLEAQAAGRPVICSGIGGMAEMVEDRVTGLLVPPGDAEELAQVMLEAARDPGLWNRLAAARTGAGREAFINGHIALYRSLMEKVAA